MDETDAAGPRLLAFRDPRGRTRRMVLRLDPVSHIPPFEQLRAQLSVMVSVGHLEPGARLPTVREMAGGLGLAPGTVSRVFRELERDGIIEGRGRKGTFVVDEPPGSEPVLERRRRLERAATTFAFAARQLGITPRAALDAAQAAFDQLADDER